MIELTTKRRASPRRIGMSRKSSEEIISSVIKEFLTNLPPPEECSLCSKNKVTSDLQLKKDILIAKERSFAAHNFFSESEIDDVCIILDSQLTDMISDYITPIVKAAKYIANKKTKENIPNDPGDIGVALPTLSRKILEKAIERKKEEIALLMVKDIEEYHFSWYSGDESLGFDEEIDAWADTVRARSKDLKKKWIFRSFVSLLLLLPIVVSMFFYSSDKCKPGFYNTVSVTDDTGVLTVSTLPQCLPCERGSFAPGGKKSSRSLCPISTYSNDFAEECWSCPEHSFNMKEGSSTCECIEGYKNVFKKSEHHIRHLECEKIFFAETRNDTVLKLVQNEAEKTVLGENLLDVKTEEINKIVNNVENVEVRDDSLSEVVIDDKGEARGEVDMNTIAERKTATEPEVKIIDTKRGDMEIIVTGTEEEIVKKAESTEIENTKIENTEIENTEIVEIEPEELTESVTATTETENTETIEWEIVESEHEIREVLEKKTVEISDVADVIETEIAIKETETTESENTKLLDTRIADSGINSEVTEVTETGITETIITETIVTETKITDFTSELTDFTADNSSAETELDSVSNDMINFNMKIIGEIDEESRLQRD